MLQQRCLAINLHVMEMTIAFLNLPLRFICRIYIIFGPQNGIGLDVIRFVLQIFFIADDMFVIITLPNGDIFCSAHQIDPIGNRGFI
jgi:hypothetical protein